MHVHKLTAYILRVHLRKPFRHAGAVRKYSDNLLVRCELANRIYGWGEGVPREYVTGESAEGGLEQFEATPFAEQLSAGASNWEEVIALCDRIELKSTAEDPRGCHGNALRAAVELSLLDAYGKLLGEPVSRVVDHFPEAAEIRHRRNEVYYSTAIDAERPRKLWRSALKMRTFGFKQCKVKVGVEQAADAARLGVIREWIGPGVDLRVDVNEGWTPDTMVAHAASLLPMGISCIEQPLPHEDLAALSELRKQVECPIMLDESLCSMHDAREALRLDACDLFNIRLSKCGGFLNSLRLAALARKHGLGYQLGCHPGETGILSAAGRHFATSIGEIWYLEGSYDRFVMAHPLTSPNLTFGYGGRATPIRRPGLGAKPVPWRVWRHLRDRREMILGT